MNAKTATAINTVANTIIGYIVYHTLSRNVVNPDEVNEALADAGFENWSVSGMPYETVFRAKCRSITHKYDVSGVGRKLFALELEEDKDSVAFGVHVGKATGRKHSMAQLINIWLDKSSETVGWRFTDAPRRHNETEEEYIERYVSTVAYPVTEQDVNEAVRIVREIKTRTEDEGGMVENSRMHEMIRKLLIRPEMHVTPLRPTGGIYFVPSVPERADNPAERAIAMGKVVEAVGEHNSLFMIPQYPNPETNRAISHSAAETLSARVSQLHGQLDDLSETSHPLAISSRMGHIREVLDSADIYAQLVGMKADELRTKAGQVRDHLKGILDARNAARDAKTKAENEAIEKRAAEKLGEEKVAKAKAMANEQVGKKNGTTVKSTFTPLSTSEIRACAKDALATGEGVNADLTVVKHKRGPYQWWLQSQSNETAVDGTAPTQAKLIAAVRAAFKAHLPR